MDKVAAYFKFLYFLPSVDIATLEPDKRDCSICLEPYDSTPWGDADTVNQPVRLACSHVFGIQCLARWAFSPNFNNVCPHCGDPLITGTHLSRNQSSQIIQNLLQLRRQFDNPFHSHQQAQSFKKLLAETRGEGGLMTASEDADRMMIIFDEYFKTGGDTATLAPLSWRELDWWSMERNDFTCVMVVLVSLLLFVVVLVWFSYQILYPLVKVLVRSIYSVLSC